MEDLQKSEKITFVVAVNDFRELDQNLFASRVRSNPNHEWIVLDNRHGSVSGISELYNNALSAAKNDLVFFFHQDVFLPDHWEDNLFSQLNILEDFDPHWGVIGAVGVASVSSTQKRLVGHWKDPHGYRKTENLPSEVQSLDELFLGVRKSSGIRFDSELRGYHCYGVDICMTSRKAGLKCYAIDAFLRHKFKDTDGQIIERPEDSLKIMERSTPEFQASFRYAKDYIRNKWEEYLPFYSTSANWLP